MGTIEKLNNSNYAIWKLKIEALLDRKGLTHYITWDGNATEQSDGDGDQKARSYMILNIEDDQFKYVRNGDTAKSVWEALAAEHESKTYLALIDLESKYANLQWNRSKTTLDEFLDQFMDIVRQLEASGDMVEQATRVRKLLSAMPPQFRTIAHKLEQFPPAKQTLAQAMHALREEQQYFELNMKKKKREDDIPTHDKALNAKETRKCYNCNTIGHIARNCRKPKKKKFNPTHDYRPADKANYGRTHRRKEDYGRTHSGNNNHGRTHEVDDYLFIVVECVASRKAKVKTQEAR